MSLLLAIYLAGFAGTAGYFGSSCTDQHRQVSCIASATAVGAVWPIAGLAAGTILAIDPAGDRH